MSQKEKPKDQTHKEMFTICRNYGKTKLQMSPFYIYKLPTKI